MLKRYIVLILFLSFIVSVFSAGLAYRSYLTPQTAMSEFYKIHNDTWLENGATVSFQNLYHRGNKLIIKFSSWHPAGVGAPNITASVCGKEATNFIAEKSSEQVVYLTGDCNPRITGFKIQDPFKVNASDSRELGAQVESVQVTSKLGVPILDLKTLGKLTLCVFILSLLVYLSFSNIWLAFVSLGISFNFIYISKHLNYINAYNLWFFCTAFFTGVYFYQSLKKTRVLQTDLRNQSQLDPGSLL